jgi:hypothetical protein
MRHSIVLRDGIKREMRCVALEKSAGCGAAAVVAGVGRQGTLLTAFIYKLNFSFIMH